MESSIALHSFKCKFNGQRLTVGRRLVSSPSKRNLSLVSCLKTPEPSVVSATKSDGGASTGFLEKSSVPSATFPNGFEALVLEVCDETEIAELKMKVGDFEMQLRRNVGAIKGDLIKKGQVIGYLDQFGTELPAKSDVAGEVLKILFDDGDGVGYGDPLIAVLPSFHGIN